MAADTINGHKYIFFAVEKKTKTKLTYSVAMHKLYLSLSVICVCCNAFGPRSMPSR